MPTRTTTLQLCIALTMLGVAVPVAAQQQGKPPEPSWKRSFDQVEVEQVDPDKLPGPDESVLPAALSSKSSLPRAISLQTLGKSSVKVAPMVLGVVVVPGNDSPVRQSPIVVQGEAVWVSGDGEDRPLLITNAHYLKGADAIFVRPSKPKKSGALPTAPRRSVSQMSLGADVKALMEDKSLIAATVEHVDVHRNLAVLRVPEDKLPTPRTGLAFFPIEEQAVAAAYGFSHQMGSTLVATRFLIPKKKDHLEYYLHTTYPVILGAPIVAPDGRLIAMTAMRHPADPDRTLVIPPRAMRKYVEMVQANVDEQNAENAKDSK